jgi:hypothetical protein
MAIFSLGVTGHAVVPTQGGPDVFDNVAGLGWTDQQGHRRVTDVRFNGKGGQRPVDFHFPITVPFAFGPGTSALAMTVDTVVVTFFTDPAVNVSRIRVADRTGAVLFNSGLLALSHPTLFRSPVTGSNRLFFSPVLIRTPIFVTVAVNFGTGGIIGFTSASLSVQNQ